MLRFLASLPTGPAAAPRSARHGKSASPSPLHLHRYRRTGDDPFSGASLYACRCGVVRPGL